MGGIVHLLVLALVPFLFGVSIGAALARVRWGPAASVILGAAIALPFFLQGVNEPDHPDVTRYGGFFAFIIGSAFVLWALGVGTGVVLTRLLEPAPKR